MNPVGYHSLKIVLSPPLRHTDPPSYGKMLDWLNANQAASVTEESQVPDAPETPAPIFAYRALKGILFGSPDYDNEDEDKENIAPANPIQKVTPSVQDQSRSVHVSALPLRSKSPQSRAREGCEGSPSPRTRRQLSPTKSILRTPGIPTPRRQNVNVTFKDVRASVSPTGVTTKLLAARNEAKAAKEASNTTAATTTSDAPLGLGPAAHTVEPLPVPAYDLRSVDAYLKSTEREMKKLVRYSQRMREYARLSQQESAALKKERDGLRKELDEVRKAKAMTKETSGGRKLGEKASVNGTAATKPVARMPGPRSTWESTSPANRPDKIHTVKAAGLRDRDASGDCRRSEEAGSRSSAKHAGKKEAGDILTHDGGYVAEIVSKKRAATTAQLPPDRLAAAKERLRVKSEERRRALSAATA
jgi:hypothetical protein